MCGIVGIVTANGTVDPDVLQRMNDRVEHRGPDGEGFLLASGDWDRLRYSFQRRASQAASGDAPVRVGLGHRRLAILDLSDRGLQPMCTPDRRTWIVFNGEIYNHRQLRSLLESAGHEFATRTDTEVLLKAYVEWGEDCIDRLDGMFALAIWDDTRRRLFCARDRLGIKPFYYATAADSFVFASEIKALFAFPACRPDADDHAVVGFLAHGNCDYVDRTLFRGVRALPAAHTLTVDATGRTAIRRYWSLDPPARREQSDAEHVAELRETLVETVRSHLISDVRVGSCLSGGLDSSTLVGVIGKIWREQPESAAAIGDRLSTFTSCYEQKAFDEREYALEIARSAGARPQLVFPSPEDFWSDFHRMAWHQDMPFGALSFYAQWRVMRAASEAGVKVLIDGQGGDEVFGGYAKFRYAYLASLLRSGRFGTAARELTGMLRQGDRYVLDIRNGYRYLPPFMRRALKMDSALQRIVTADWKAAVADDSTPAARWWRNASRDGSGSACTSLQRIQIDDIGVDTLPQLLRMEDRSSMAFSLEARVPLLDHHVVELGLSLPDHLKVNQGWSKFAVRQAMAGLVPDAVRLRKTKLGFAAPDRSWLAGDLRPAITSLLGEELRCRRYVDVAALRRWYGAANARSANTESFLGLFRILSLEMWMRAFQL
ncbi:MAG: asparagine synthase (glutamine-hydrolyzing) [Acidobacteriota bacterium]